MESTLSQAALSSCAIEQKITAAGKMFGRAWAPSARSSHPYLFRSLTVRELDTRRSAQGDGPEG